MEPTELSRRLSEIRWFHTIDLGNGVVTPGIDNTPRKLARIQMPDDLSGQTVLDIGAWDGFFSFEAERRRALRVLATDSYSWDGAGWGTKAGFDLAREALGSHVEDRALDVMDLSPETVGVFDLVLFLGVLYHLRHPLLALEKVASVTARQLILETEVALTGVPCPAMAFYPGTQLNNDPTNWWAPNPRALKEMLKDVGFTRIEVVSPPANPAYRAARAVTKCLTRRKNPLLEYWTGRIAVHAWK